MKWYVKSSAKREEDKRSIRRLRERKNKMTFHEGGI
jgi:hypothetical protein